MNLEQRGLQFLRSINRSMSDLHLGFSGGKDSVVIYDLAKRAGVKFVAQYSNTTIDPPGTMGLIRGNFKDVKIVHPVESFYQLVERKGLPVRRTRYCCEYLKERIGIGRNNIIGIRASEGFNRLGRDYVQCDSRSWMKGAQHIYPIYDWLDDDVWGYIDKYNLPVAPCYGKGLKRLGCIGCPLINPNKRRFEFSVYPRYYEAIKRVIGRGMERNPQWKISVATGGDSEVAMRWWLSNKTINDYFCDYRFIKEGGKWYKRAVVEWLSKRICSD